MILAASTYAAIVRPLQFLVLALAGLFFVRVVMVATTDMKPEDAPSRRGRNRSYGLKFIEPESMAGERIELTNTITMGRGGASDLALDDQFLSTTHARFTVDGGDLFLEDLGSRNGTFINAEPVIYRTQLIKGDIVQLGNTIFEVTR